MKILLRIASLLAGIAVLFTSCKKEPMLTVSNDSPIEYTAQGGSEGVITFTTNRHWVATCSYDWVRLDPASGDASDKPQTITVICEPNQTYDDRRATVVIEADGVKGAAYVIQTRTPAIMPKHSSFEINADSQRIELDVQSTLNYTVQVDGSWLSRIEDTKALSDSKIVLNVNANLSGAERTASIFIKSDDPLADIEQVVTVKQAPEQPGVPVLVDLGLSVKWANKNLGATNCYDAGDFFAWGEVTPKKVFTEENYRFYSGDPQSPTKYFVTNTNGDTGDGIRDLEAEDDAAVQILGDGWRMPDYKEILELVCLTMGREYVVMNGMPGLKIVNYKNPENWIFLPAPRCYDNSPDDNYCASYWSRTGYEIADVARVMAVESTWNSMGTSGGLRWFGLPIRPVKD